ncbi:hypothetical protein [Actinomadura citrea]|uniref:Uncharacterized protein n=1 Tax=Actinomadura citrea TaxID=46158 RepID=A0A7Y9GH78_9ACTN|nr:hypothetical protein [Actinomadura citrea]NYE16427.1 hypothetical protein [Actinomadura citrea]GGT95064.1 hypothetical protein GCM10010177_62620 [Actinomadura citrea]
MAINNAPHHGDYDRAPTGRSYSVAPHSSGSSAGSAADTGRTEQPAPVESGTPDPLVQAYLAAGEVKSEG